MYDAAADLVFGVPGAWRIKVCEEPRCRTIWPDPSPSDSGLAQAYERYYTHGAESVERAGLAATVFRTLWWFTGLSAQRRALQNMFLDGVPPGLLLDVGCGDARRFPRLEALGWTVEGQDVDPLAVNQARKTGRRVHFGDLADLGLAPGAYDAITMNHVIEHVRDPLALLAECRRLLRAGGRVVALTPNAASTGHHAFGVAWRGLEPPRHLQVFTPWSLDTVARRAGFSRVDVRTTAANAYTLAVASLGIAARGAGTSTGFVRTRIDALRFQWKASSAHRVNGDAGEECLLTAIA